MHMWSTSSHFMICHSKSAIEPLLDKQIGLRMWSIMARQGLVREELVFQLIVYQDHVRALVGRCKKYP
jgi:hypothetical protein